MTQIALLKGIRVLLIAHYIPGPLAAYLLRWLGAEVIKVEPPFGDLMRQLPPLSETGNSAFFETLNAGMKSIVVNFKCPQGVAVLKSLIKKSEIVIDGNRAGYLQKVLGEGIADINPAACHIPITAYGITGPWRDIAGHDNNVLSIAGTLGHSSQTREQFPPTLGIQLADITSGYIAALMGLAHVVGKNCNNPSVPQNLFDVSMLHSAFFLNQLYVGAMNITKKCPRPEAELLNGALPNYRMYKTADDCVFFGPIEPHLFNNFCDHINRLDLKLLLNKDNGSLGQELTNLFKTKTTSEWLELMKDVDCCLTGVNSLEDAINHEQIRALGLVQTVNDFQRAAYPAGVSLQSNPPAIDQSAPKLGEHSKQILQELLGFSEDKINDLYKENSIK